MKVYAKAVPGALRARVLGKRPDLYGIASTYEAADGHRFERTFPRFRDLMAHAADNGWTVSYLVSGLEVAS